MRSQVLNWGTCTRTWELQISAVQLLNSWDELPMQHADQVRQRLPTQFHSQAHASSLVLRPLFLWRTCCQSRMSINLQKKSEYGTRRAPHGEEGNAV